MKKKIKDYSKLKLILEIVAVIFLIAVAFGIRVIPSYNVIFQDNKINYASVDDYFYMRIADNMMVNWPNFTTIDPYRNYPEGVTVDNTRLFHPTIIAGISRFTGIGHDIVAAWLPPIYGVLAIFFLYLMTRFTFNRPVGLITLAFLSTASGEFATRTSLGAIDQHCLEVFLSSFMMSFLILSLSVKFRTLKIVFSIMAGVGIFLYIKAWEGAALFLGIIAIATFIWWLIETIKELYRATKTTSLPYWQLLICLITTVVILTATGSLSTQTFIAVGVILGIIFLWILHKLQAKIRLILAIACPIIIVISTWLILPMQTEYAISYIAGLLKMLVSWSFVTATAEEAPLFVAHGEFSLSIAWIYFAGVLYLFLVGIGLLGYYVTKKENRISFLMILVWGIILFIATMAMIRSAYYMSIPICIIAGYFSWLLYVWIAATDSKRPRTFSPGTILIITTVIAMLSVIPFINVNMGLGNTARGGIITPGWQEAIGWMKTNTAEPIDNGYGSVYTETKYPDTAYGIMTWWDYGYWILREGHRITYSDPGGGNRRFCGWFLSTDNITEALESVKAMNIKYIVIDYSMTTGKNYSIVQHAAERAKDFQEPFRLYYDRRSGSYNQMQINYPSYYRELMVRLYNFNSLAVDSPGCPVFRYEEIDGNREIIEAIDLPDYDTAVSYVAQHKNATYIIGGTSPFLSPIQIDALPQFVPVFFSRSMVKIDNGIMIPEVKIFKVVE